MQLKRTISIFGLFLVLAIFPAGLKALDADSEEIQTLRLLEQLLVQRQALEVQEGEVGKKHERVLADLAPLKTQQEADYSWLRGFTLRNLLAEAQTLSEERSGLRGEIDRKKEEMDLTSRPLVNKLSEQLVSVATRMGHTPADQRMELETAIGRIVQAIDGIAARYDLSLENELAALVIPRILLDEDFGDPDDLENLEQRLELLSETVVKAQSYRKQLDRRIANHKTYETVKNIVTNRRKTQRFFGDSNPTNPIFEQARTPNPGSDPGSEAPGGSDDGATADEAPPPGEMGVMGSTRDPSPGASLQPPSTPEGTDGGTIADPTQPTEGSSPTDPGSAALDPPVVVDEPDGSTVFRFIDAIPNELALGDEPMGQPSDETSKVIQSLLINATANEGEVGTLVFAPISDRHQLEKQVIDVQEITQTLIEQKTRLEKRLKLLKQP